MAKKKVNYITLNAESISVRTKLGISKDITEYTGIHAMILAAMPNVQLAYERNLTPYDVYIDTPTLLAVNKVCFDVYEDDAVDVYLSPATGSKPMIRIKDVRYAPKSKEKAKKAKLVDSINNHLRKV